MESKIEEVIEENLFGFWEGKGTRDAIGLMRIISERMLDIKGQMTKIKGVERRRTQLLDDL